MYLIICYICKYKIRRYLFKYNKCLINNFYLWNIVLQYMIHFLFLPYNCNKKYIYSNKVVWHMRTLKADRDSCLHNHEILNCRDYRSEKHAKEINGDDSGAFHVSFTLALSFNDVSKLHCSNISLRDTREGSQTFASSAISKAPAWSIFVLSNRAELVLRTLQSIYLLLISQSASTCRAGWILRTLGFCGWFIRSCVKRHSICFPSRKRTHTYIFSLSFSLCSHREINARHKVQWNARP